ncbi:MAG: FMN-binding protein [Myxococcales bacterium]|nr:FMN-binding protein [Myxococcales bacterium]
MLENEIQSRGMKRRLVGREGVIGRWALVTGGLLALCLVGPAQAKVFLSKAGALEAVFPGASVEQVNLYLSDADEAAIATAAGEPWPTRLANMYVGRAGEAIVGYAFIDTHQVRSLNETLMVVLSPEGEVKQVVVLAFHEPEEYLASPRWLMQFVGRALDASLKVQSGVDGLSGATLTARAVTASVRRVLGLYGRKVATAKAN